MVASIRPSGGQDHYLEPNSVPLGCRHTTPQTVPWHLRLWQENVRVLTPLLMPSLVKRLVKVAAFSMDLLTKIFIFQSHYSSQEERASLSSKMETPSRLRVSVPYCQARQTSLRLKQSPDNLSTYCWSSTMNEKRKCLPWPRAFIYIVTVTFLSTVKWTPWSWCAGPSDWNEVF